MIKYTELWDKIIYLIKTINEDKADEYEKDFMKIKFNSGDNLPLNKVLKLHNLKVIIRSVFEEDVLFVFIGILKILVLSMKRIFAMAVMI